MAKTHVIMRVSALSLVGGALLILFSDAGRLPFGEAPDAEVRAADLHRQPLADGFAATQAMVLPGNAGFGAAPAISGHGWSSTASVADEHLRPAAFAPAPRLGQPLDAAPRPAPTGQQAFSPLGLPCGLEVTAAATDHATIALGVAAPCQPGAAVEVGHAGLTLGGATDAVGLLTLDLPAFESPAHVTVRLADGTEAETLVEIPDLAVYDRVALAWAGDLGLELHAMEADAGWQQPGHVHPGSMRGPEALEDGGGFLTELGTDVGRVQVYTRPREDQATAAEVTISVDAPVTEKTCTRRVAASLLRMEGGGAAALTPLSLSYPACHAVGETLVLQHALRDMRLAAN
jgi:hypothetical protein